MSKETGCSGCISVIDINNQPVIITIILESVSLETGSENFFCGARNKNKPRIALVASIAWTLWNYRMSLINSLEAAGYEVLLFADADEACPKIAAHCKATFIPLRNINRKSLSPFRNFLLMAEMFRLFRRHKPDLLLFFTVRPNTLGNFAAAMAGIPSISTVEGMGIAGKNRPWLLWVTNLLYRLAFRFTQKVVFLNQEDYHEFVEQHLVNSNKATVIHGPGVDVHHFSPASTPPDQPLVFLFVARLLSEKGIREFAQAARILRQEGTNAVFQVLGSVDPGNPTTIDTSELLAWKAEGILQHLGFVDDVRPALAAADILVLLSYYREGLPRSILEAMAMEKVILTTDNVGCRDTVENGVNGYIIEPKNVPALAETMKKILLLSPEQRRNMGANSRRKVIAEFSDDWCFHDILS